MYYTHINKVPTKCQRMLDVGHLLGAYALVRY